MIARASSGLPPLNIQSSSQGYRISPSMTRAPNHDTEIPTLSYRALSQQRRKR
jgi:hypothetical protein